LHGAPPLRRPCATGAGADAPPDPLRRVGPADRALRHRHDAGDRDRALRALLCGSDAIGARGGGPRLRAGPPIRRAAGPGRAGSGLLATSDQSCYRRKGTPGSMMYNYNKPKGVNLVSIFFLLVLLAGIYVAVKFVPVWW